MKVNRESGPPIIIGKRVAIGQIIASCVTIGAFVWDGLNPESQMSAGITMAITQGVTGIVQMVIVNVYGVTK
jgi:hypothetical protein